MYQREEWVEVQLHCSQLGQVQALIGWRREGVVEELVVEVVDQVGPLVVVDQTLVVIRPESQRVISQIIIEGRES